MIHNVLTTLSHKNIFYEQINNTNIGGMCFKKKKKKDNTLSFKNSTGSRPTEKQSRMEQEVRGL